MGAYLERKIRATLNVSVYETEQDLMSAIKRDRLLDVIDDDLDMSVYETEFGRGRELCAPWDSNPEPSD